MPSLMYNEGARQLQSGGSVNFSSDNIDIILLASSYTPNKDDAIATVVAGELSGVSGYTGGFGGAGRKALGTKTITKDTTNDRIVYDAADPSAWTLAAGGTVGGAAIIKRGSASDTDAVPLAYLDFTDTPTNGSTFTITFDATGIFYTQQ